MKKAIAILSIFVLTSFKTVNPPKTFHFEFTAEEVNLIYTGLGKLPAEQVDQLRAKIVSEYQKQMTDTTNKK